MRRAKEEQDGFKQTMACPAPRATDTGVLAVCVDELFALGGFWTRA